MACRYIRSNLVPRESHIKKNNVLRIKFVARSNKFFHWPENPDIQDVHPAQVLCKINPLETASAKNKRKNLLQMTEKQIKFVNKAFQDCSIY